MLGSFINSHLLRSLLAVIVALTCITPVLAQSNITVNIDGMESGPAGRMTAYVTVRDENGVPVSGLTPQNFAIVEDQRTSFPPDALSTRVNPRAALSIALVIDLSGTMRDQALTEARAASRALLETLLDEPNDPDRAAFFGINGPVDINELSIREGQEIGFTNDRNRILNLINVLEGSPGVATPLYDALFRVIKITSRQQSPRAIIVLTDGQDPRVSKLAADDPIAEANRNNIPIFPIGFSKGTINDAYLTRLAARTGGAYTKAAQAGEITGLFQDILKKLSEQYVLTYQTRLVRDAQPHAVIIRVDSPKGKAFDDEIFMFRDVPTAAPPTPTRASEPAAVIATATTQAAPSTVRQPEPQIQPTPRPTPEPFPRNVLTTLNNFVADQGNLPYLIGLMVALMLILAFLIFLIVRRNRAIQETPEEEYPPTGSTGSGFEVPASANASVPPTDVDISSRPATALHYPGIGGITETTSTAQSFSGGAFAQPSDRTSSAPVEGGTVILPRGPKIQAAAILVNRKQPQQRYDVFPSTDIGRANTNTIVLQNATVSRQHAKIKAEKNEFVLFDLGSANGTFVNDQRITDPVTLKDGDVVRFGELEFLFKRLL